MPRQPKAQALTRLPQDRDAAERALHDVLLRLFGRTPTDAELANWGARLAGGLDARQFAGQVVKGCGYLANSAVRTRNPAGHFCSPVVDPDQVVAYVAQTRAAGLEALAGIVHWFCACAESGQRRAFRTVPPVSAGIHRPADFS